MNQIQDTVIKQLTDSIEKNLTSLAVANDSATAAWLVRNLLELQVWIEHCLKSPTNAEEFQLDAIRDMKDIFNRIFGSRPDAKQIFDQFQSVIAELGKPLKPGSLDESYKKVPDIAKALGRTDFAIAFKVLSKLAHPTAMWVMMGGQDDIAMRDVLKKQGATIAESAVKTVLEFRKANP